MDVNYYKRLVHARDVEIKMLRKKIKKLEEELESCQALK